MAWLILFTMAFGLLQTPAGSAIATFSGVFKSADKKYVVISLENGETMRMYVTRGTRFIREGKAARAGDFHDGEAVDVDAERDARMNLLAVRVEKRKSSG
jgi:hypothetical protein